MDLPRPLPDGAADAGRAAGSSRITGATNRYPRRGTVWMQLPFARPLIEHAAQRCDLDRQIIVFDHDTRPRGGHDLIPRDKR
jgi:hypothetical protein